MTPRQDKSWHDLNSHWRREAWQRRHHQQFTWGGLPIMQLPEDIVRLQMLIHDLQPKAIIETGVAGGGSILFYAERLAALGTGRQVIGIDRALSKKTQQALRQGPLADSITLIHGDSTDPATVEKVRQVLRPDAQDSVLVILDSAHYKAHVQQELALYTPFVSKGSYCLVADGCLAEVADTPRGQAHWREDNAWAAVAEFLKDHPTFTQVPLPDLAGPSHFEGGWLQCCP